jgi:antitoxin MazE
MRSQIRKWGNSLAVRIPRSVAADLGVVQDSSVELSVEDGCLLVRPSTASPYALETLLAAVTAENLHAEVDLGTAIGKEAW